MLNIHRRASKIRLSVLQIQDVLAVTASSVIRTGLKIGIIKEEEDRASAAKWRVEQQRMYCVDLH